MVLGRLIMPKKKEPCENADSNPICPYLTQINQSIEDIKQVKNALVGEDLQSGLVKKIADLEASIKTAASWANFGKPIILGVIMAVIAGVISRLI